ncbi:hypothetical protein Droror1_Dr00002214 [Drosera rotundifolia]
MIASQLGGILYGIWTNRNQMLHRGQIIPAIVVVQLALNAAQEFVSLHVKEKKPREVNMEGIERRHHGWSPPTPGSLKGDVDASVNNAGFASTAVVIRDDRGMVCGAFGRVYERISSPEIGQALAIRDGIEMAISLCLPRVLVETDCQVLAKKFTEHNPDLSYAGGIIHDCIQRIHFFSEFRWSWVPGETNEAAHSMACYISKCYPVRRSVNSCLKM